MAPTLIAVHSRIAGRCAAAALVGLSSACASYSTFKEAHPIDAGTFRFDLAMSGVSAAPKSGAVPFMVGGNDPPRSSTLPDLELQFRWGIAHGFDLGLKTNLSSIEVNGTVQILRGDSFELAAAPAFQGAVGINGDDKGWSMALLKLPFLTGMRFGESGRHELVLGPALAKSWGRGNEGYPMDALFAGGTIGVAFAAARIGRVMPELAIYTVLAGNGVPLPGNVVRVSPDVGGGRPVLIQAGVAFSFGSGSR